MEGAALQLIFTVLGIISSLARSPNSARHTPNLTELSLISFPSPIRSQSMKEVEASLSAVTRTSTTWLIEVALAQGWYKQLTRRVFESALAEEPGCYPTFRFVGYRDADPSNTSNLVWGRLTLLCL